MIVMCFPPSLPNLFSGSREYNFTERGTCQSNTTIYLISFNDTASLLPLSPQQCHHTQIFTWVFWPQLLVVTLGSWPTEPSPFSLHAFWMICNSPDKDISTGSIWLRQPDYPQEIQSLRQVWQFLLVTPDIWEAKVRGQVSLGYRTNSS